ncbi:MAG: bifunctional DNA-formamidopyrimidine glycosylase/DNA-(apurinic or apyrimidinic site) lyase [Burkholderiales bacterium]|jgi:formamidopyrimidine-DNA glycosylase|nr:bifunctional DNA-formamidopyrimidine glycosylase/DNA-(apurinic or apyrimidinic site) lyase [Burkholderiales bacterium]
MPELPEVEVTRHALARHVEGRKVRAVDVRERRLRWPVTPGLARLLVGQPVRALDRRGKYLLWRFEHGTLISHLGMSGSWRVHLKTAPAPGTHDHVDVSVDDALLRLTDPRRFGALLWHAAARGPVEAHPLLAHLGIEPFDPRFDGHWLYRGTRGRAAAIKQVLLAGDVVVGVGNIYASESLFRAGINPKLPARRIGPARCELLAAAIRAVLAEAIEVGGSTLRDFRSARGEEGYFMVDALVYDRGGQPCKRCGTPIRKLVQGQRATYYCVRCQR